MTLYSLKPRFQALLRPTVDLLADAGITANQVTVAAALGSLAVGTVVALFAAQPAVFLLLPVWLLLRMALNAIDGLLAREHGQTSRLGAFLNEIGDVVSDAALIAPFALLAPFSAFAVALVVALAMLSEMAGVLGQTIGASRRATVGPAPAYLRLRAAGEQETLYRVERTGAAGSDVLRIEAVPTGTYRFAESDPPVAGREPPAA